MNLPTDTQKLVATWSKLVGRTVTPEEARDLDETFAGGPPNPNLGYEPQDVSEDNDEGEDELVSAAPSDSEPRHLLSREPESGGTRKRTSRLLSGR